jgi:hypothetical protein
MKIVGGRGLFFLVGHTSVIQSQKAVIVTGWDPERSDKCGSM